MNDYVLNEKTEPAANDMVWAFDLGHPLRLERGEDRGEVSNPDHQKTEVNPTSPICARGFPAHPGGICRNQNRRRSPPDVAHASGTRFIVICRCSFDRQTQLARE